MTMPKDNFTPEEKLLRIIESGPGQMGKFAPDKLPGSPKQALAPFKMPVFGKDALKKIKLADIKKIILVLCIVLTAALAVDFIRSANIFHKRFDTLIIGKEDAARDEPGDTGISPRVDDALAAQQERNLFSFTPPKPQPSAGGQDEDLPSLSNLKLVGIIWSDAPQAMVEEQKEQKTNVLNVGDQIGVFRVKQILKDSVILESGTVEQQLR